MSDDKSVEVEAGRLLVNKAINDCFLTHRVYRRQKEGFGTILNFYILGLVASPIIAGLAWLSGGRSLVEGCLVVVAFGLLLVGLRVEILILRRKLRNRIFMIERLGFGVYCDVSSDSPSKSALCIVPPDKRKDTYLRILSGPLGLQSTEVDFKVYDRLFGI